MYPSGIENLLFPALALSIVGLSLAVVVVRNPVIATFLLIGSFLPTTGIYMLLHAPLVGIFQILIYAGAILVLFTFVVMMVNPGPGSFAPGVDEKGGRGRIFLFAFGALVAAAFPAVLAAYFLQADAVVSNAAPAFGSLKSIGRLIFTASDNNPLTVSFELLSFLILAGMVIALNLTRSRRKKGRTS